MQTIHTVTDTADRSSGSCSRSGTVTPSGRTGTGPAAGRHTIKSLPEDLRPTERCIRSGGPGTLSDAELLGVILRTGTEGRSAVDMASDVLRLGRDHCGLAGLMHLTFADLTGIRGIGPVKAAEILCICELSRRMAQHARKESMRFDDAASIASYFRSRLEHEEQEQVICLMLDTRNRMIGEMLLSKGTVSASLISPREVFLAALSFRAVSLILVHNHPSGDPSPSAQDIAATIQVHAAGELVGIRLLDHIIIGGNAYVSFLQDGYDPFEGN